MNRRVIVLAVAMAAVVAAAMVALRAFDSEPGGGVRLRPDDAKLVALGETVYRGHCASCHGAALEGQPDWRTRGPDGLLPAPPHDASGHTWHHPDQVLFDIVKFGVARTANLAGYRTAMPVYEGVLGDDEIVAVLSWIKSRWPADIRAYQDQANVRHRESAAARR